MGSHRAGHYWSDLAHIKGRRRGGRKKAQIFDFTNWMLQLQVSLPTICQEYETLSFVKHRPGIRCPHFLSVAAALSLSCVWLCGPMDCSLPGSSIHGILQVRILECVPLPSPENLPDPGIEPVSPVSPALAGRFFTAKTPGSYLQGGINSALEGFCKPHGAFLKRNNDSKGVQEAHQGHLWALKSPSSVSQRARFPPLAGSSTCQQNQYQPPHRMATVYQPYAGRFTSIPSDSLKWESDIFIWFPESEPVEIHNGLTRCWILPFWRPTLGGTITSYWQRKLDWLQADNIVRNDILFSYWHYCLLNLYMTNCFLSLPSDTMIWHQPRS